MNRKFDYYSSSSFSFSCSPSSFRDGGRRLLLSAITIITIALLVLLPSSSSLFSFYVHANDFAAFASPSSISQSETATTVPVPPPPPPSPPPSPSISSQSSQSQTQEKAVGPLVDNFNLPAGYIIEPFLWNLSMPTSIAVDSGKGTIYVTESIMEYNDDNNSSSIAPSPSSIISFPSEQQRLQVRIVKADISDDNSSIINQTSDSSSGARINDDNNTTIINNALNWPVIDTEVDDASGLLYAFDGHATISRINMTSGEREDILAAEEEEAAAGNDKYEEEEQQEDPLSLIINFSSQIALSGKEEDYHHGPGDNDEKGSRNYDSYNPTVLYIPCMNGEVDNYNEDRYCILSLPIDDSGNNTIVDSISNINNPSSFILQNMTSRPVGIAILNSSYAAVLSSSSPSSSSLPSSSSSITEQQRPYAITRNQTSNSFGNNYTELLIITSQPTSNSIVNINNNNNSENSSKYNHHQQQLALPPPPSIDTLVDYPDGQLGKVVAVLVPPVSISSSSNDTIERNQASSTDEDIVSSSPSLPFGLNKTMAFIVDFGNSSDSAATAAPQLPKIIMLDVQTGSITPFLTLKHSDSNFTPVDVAFDYNNSALYVLSISNNKEEDTNNNSNNNTINPLHTGTSNNNNSGIIWKISYQDEEGQAATSSNSSSSSNGTDNNNNATADLAVPPPPPPASSSNDTASPDNSTSDSSSSYDDSSSYDEEEDDTDDDSSSDSLEPPPPPSDDSDSNSSSSSKEDTDNDSGNSESSTPSPPSSPGDSSSPPPPSQPSTQPVNDAPIAEDDAATTDQDTPVVIDVLANDRDIDDDDSLTIDSVDEESIQGGNVRIISSSDNDDNNNNGGGNTNAKIEYTPVEGFFGNDEFTYTIIDTNGATDSAKVTVTVNEIVIASHPISYWLENEDGITQDLLEKAAEGHDNNNNNEWSFKLGNFRVPVDFDISDSENDTKGILEAYYVAEGRGGGGEGEENNDSNNNDHDTNAYDQLAAQLLASKLNIENGVFSCESIETTIEYANTVLRNVQYDGPGSTENPTGESRDYAFELIEILDRYNNNGAVCA